MLGYDQATVRPTVQVQYEYKKTGTVPYVDDQAPYYSYEYEYEYCDADDEAARSCSCLQACAGHVRFVFVDMPAADCRAAERVDF